MSKPRQRPMPTAPPLTDPDQQAEAFEQSEGLEGIGGPEDDDDRLDDDGSPPPPPADDATAGPTAAAAAELRSLMGLDAVSKELVGELRVRQAHQLPVRSRPQAEVLHASSVFPERFPRLTHQGWVTPEGDPCPEPFRVGGQFGARLLIAQRVGGQRRMVAARLNAPQAEWAVDLRREKVVKEYELIFDLESWRDDWLYEFSGGKLGAKDPLYKNDLEPGALPGLAAPLGTALRI